MYIDPFSILKKYIYTMYVHIYPISYVFMYHLSGVE